MPDNGRIATELLSNDNHKMIKISERLRYLEDVLNFSPDIIICGDSNGRIVEFNRGAEKLLGYSREEVIGKPITNLYFNPHDRYKIINILQRKGQVVDYETRLKNKSGRMIYISTSVAYLYNESGKLIGTIGIAKDIRRRKELDKKLERLAITDGLTNLYDRGHFNISLPKIIEKARKTQQLLSCIMIDLDGFKEYNDKEGHLGGDEVLRKVGSIIMKFISYKTGSTYRYGGDEFILLILGKKQTTPLLAEKIRKEIENNFNKRITASIGVTYWQLFQTSHQLVKNADDAMYRAKSYGGNRVCFS
jgi:diguanylate cyclase (GGDEF)-like protein/PAS domain S-box-containing protein